MAEVVGLVACVLQLVSNFAAGVELIKDLHNAPKEQLQLISEIQSLHSLVAALKARLETNDQTTDIGGLHASLSSLEDTLKRCNNKLKVDGPVTRAISWTLWNKKEAKEDLCTIERFKSLLNTWFTAHVWDVVQQQNKNHNETRSLSHSHFPERSRLSTEIKQQRPEAGSLSYVHQFSKPRAHIDPPSDIRTSLSEVSQQQRANHNGILISVQDTAHQQEAQYAGWWAD
ncbi:hypothetical protein B0H16DRAFT_1469944 [Mycena metata]|uniref:Fungal N-terminal domain-containing protein n=1 Tax=Mycena metata TaxID=1033252 RepID=A0AAD7HW01_9AGAR|nr:hypothetical protein B0H16DRAFT_1469944 [Mycena metata]